MVNQPMESADTVAIATRKGAERGRGRGGRGRRGGRGGEQNGGMDCYKDMGGRY